MYQAVTVFRMALYSVHHRRKLHIPAIYVFPVKCDFSVWWSVKCTTQYSLL